MSLCSAEEGVQLWVGGLRSAAASCNRSPGRDSILAAALGCREPRLLVCDEATSSLDSATERSIMGSLQALAAGRTSVFVAHRLSTIQVRTTALCASSGCVVGLSFGQV